MFYLENEGLRHGDIKPENILFADNGRAVLGDLGFVGSLNSFLGCTPTYAAPECSDEYERLEEVYERYEDSHKKAKINYFDFTYFKNEIEKTSYPNSDQWSLGLTMMEVLGFRLNPKQEQDLRRFFKDGRHLVFKYFRAKYIEEYKERLREDNHPLALVIFDLMHDVPSQRLSYEDLLDKLDDIRENRMREWFDDFDKELDDMESLLFSRCSETLSC